MRNALFLCCLAAVSILASSASSGQPADEPSAVDSTAEPITGQAVQPNPGSERPMKDPFVPYDPGPPEALWKYEDLTPGERAVVDRGRAEDFTSVHAGYASAIQIRSAQAASDAAALQLGISDLSTTGVVP
ncbi:MAG TPA: hypothetical protein VFQ53_30995 [Kofleriaceae bacterium]|nr:hypothetical protein [Kofleriaceae bacterium]